MQYTCRPLSNQRKYFWFTHLGTKTVSHRNTLLFVSLLPVASGPLLNKEKKTSSLYSFFFFTKHYTCLIHGQSRQRLKGLLLQSFCIFHLDRGPGSWSCFWLQICTWWPTLCLHRLPWSSARFWLWKFQALWEGKYITHVLHGNLTYQAALNIWYFVWMCEYFSIAWLCQGSIASNTTSFSWCLYSFQTRCSSTQTTDRWSGMPTVLCWMNRHNRPLISCPLPSWWT